MDGSPDLKALDDAIAIAADNTDLAKISSNLGLSCPKIFYIICKMRNRIFVFLLLSATVIHGQSLTKQDSSITYKHSSRIILKLAPLTFLYDNDHTISGAVEIHIKNKNSIQIESGYGWGSMQAFISPSVNSYDVPNGTWRAKCEWRHYTGHYQINRKKNVAIHSTSPLGNYWGVSAQLKEIEAVHFGPVDEAIHNGPAYNHLTSIHQQRCGLNFVLGRQFGWGPSKKQQNKRLLWDIYVSGGIVFISQDNKGNWESKYYQESFADGSHFNYNALTLQPNLSVGLLLGFVL